MRIVSRPAFGYVVKVRGRTITVNLRPGHRGSVALAGGVASPVLEVGARFGIVDGHRLLVAEVHAQEFVEPAEAQRAEEPRATMSQQPLRQLIAEVIGLLRPEGSEADSGPGGALTFERNATVSPPLGAECVPLLESELAQLARAGGQRLVRLGTTVDAGRPVEVDLNELLARHVAVVGSTGQGKSCFTAGFLQQLLRRYPNLGCVLFDINGEYAQAFVENPNEAEPKWRPRRGVDFTIIGPNQNAGEYRIPYYALGRNGLEALLRPSERAQRPALRFAIEALPFVRWVRDGVAVGDDEEPVLFSDCRTEGATAAHGALEKLHERITSAQSARQGVAGEDAHPAESAAPSREVAHENATRKWPPMRALAALVAERAAVQPDTSRYAAEPWKRDSFFYGNVSHLVKRIETYADDPGFSRGIDPSGGGKIEDSSDPYRAERNEVVGRFFEKGRLHIVNFRQVPNDILPFILSGLISAFLEHLFQESPGTRHPTLLVLEEAHHYIRRFRPEEEGDGHELLPYERLAKEGRKFGVSLWLSTQRPAELSSTVLSQCANWICMRLASRTDLDRVKAASEWAESGLLERIPGLARREAISFGVAFPVPVHLRVDEVHPTPQSHDPRFHERWSGEDEDRISTEEAQ